MRTKEGKSAVNEAIEYLNRLEPVKPLRWNEELGRASRDHVIDIGPKGLVQHESSDGTSVKERLKYLLKKKIDEDYWNKSNADL